MSQPESQLDWTQQPKAGDAQFYAQLYPDQQSDISNNSAMISTSKQTDNVDQIVLPHIQVSVSAVDDGLSQIQSQQQRQNGRVIVEEESYNLRNISQEAEAEQMEEDDMRNQVTQQEVVIQRYQMKTQPQTAPVKKVRRRVKKNKMTRVQKRHWQVFGEHISKKFALHLTSFYKSQRMKLAGQTLSREQSLSESYFEDSIKGYTRSELKDTFNQKEFNQYIDKKYSSDKNQIFKNKIVETKKEAIQMHKKCQKILFAEFKKQAFELKKGHIQELDYYAGQRVQNELKKLETKLEFLVFFEKSKGKPC